MKVIGRIMSFVFFVAIAATVFVVLVGLFDVDKTAELKPSGNLGSHKRPQASGDAHSNVDSSNNYSLNNGTTVQLTDEAMAALPTQLDMTALLNKVVPSVVSVEATVPVSSIFGQSLSTSTGSGILLYNEDGTIYVATNNHVVNGASEISLTLPDGSVVKATLCGSDSVADLAILAFASEDLTAETRDSLQFATLSDSKDVKVGEMVIAIGNPLGQGISVTVGYISATDREVTVGGIDMTLIQTDAAINPGNSGGALLNLSGELIGINSAKLAANSVEGMGFAIPITSALPILDELKKLEILSEEERGYLGIYIETITPEMFAAYGWPTGVYVREIIPGGAAETSDLLTGDIITGVNGITITTREQLVERINCYRHGTTIRLTVERLVDSGYETMNIEVTLQPMPETEEQ